jgi:hypothetical protein
MIEVERAHDLMNVNSPSISSNNMLKTLILSFKDAPTWSFCKKKVLSRCSKLSWGKTLLFFGQPNISRDPPK